MLNNANLSTKPNRYTYSIRNACSDFDYYSFGSLMGGRQYNSTAYDYGFNTQMKADEISGSGNHTTALFWEYDSRLGRRWNVDPKPNASISNYACFANNPIWNLDILGDTIEIEYQNENSEFKYERYFPGKKYEGTNEFVKNVFKAYDHIKNNNADKYNIIDKASKSEEFLTIKEYNGEKGAHYDGFLGTHEIFWSATQGLKVYGSNWGSVDKNKVKGILPPSILLLHETDHFIQNISGYKENSLWFWELDLWDDSSEKDVIETVERAACEVLHYPIRDNHGGDIYETSGPTSVTPQPRDINVGNGIYIKLDD